MNQVKQTNDNDTNAHAIETNERGCIRKWMLRIPLYFLFCMMLLVGTGALLLQTGLVRDILRGVLVETADRGLNATVGIDRIDGNLLSDISLEGIRVKTPDGRTVLSVERVSARYLLPMLLTRRIHVYDARIEGLRLNGEKSSDGKWNFSTLLKPSDKKEKSGSAPFPFAVAVKRFEIADALLAINGSDREAAAIRSFQIDRFIAGFDYGKTLQLSIAASSMTFDAPEALPVAVTGKTLFDPETTRIKIDRFIIRSGSSTINMDGEFRFHGKNPIIECEIGLDKIDPGDIGRRLAVSGLPGGAVSGNIDISGAPGDVRHRLFLRQDSGGVVEIDGSTGFDDTLGLRTDLSGSIRAFDIAKLRIPGARHFSGGVSTDISLKGMHLGKPEKMAARASLVIRGLSAAGIPLDSIRLDAGWSRGKADIDRLEVVSGEDRLGLSGTIDPFERNSGLDLAVHLEQPEALLDRLSSRLARIPAALTLKGKTDLTAAVSGWLDNPHARLSVKASNVGYDRLHIEMLELTGDLQGVPDADGSRAGLALTAGGVRMDGVESETLSISGSWQGPLSRYAGHAELNAHGIDIRNNPFKEFLLTADVTPEEALFSVTAGHENGSGVEIGGKAAPWTTPEKEIALGTIRMTTLSPWPELKLANTEPVRFSLTGNNTILVHTCRFGINGTRIGIEGKLAAGGEQDLKLSVDNLELSDIPGEWNAGAQLSGTVSVETRIQGPLDRPVISADTDATNLTGYGIARAADLKATMGYAGETASVQATLSTQGVSVLSVTGNAPVRLSLMPFSVGAAPGNLEARLETHKLRFSQLPIPRMKDIEWDAAADVNLRASGSLRKPDLSGSVAVHDGYLTLTGNGLTYEQVDGRLSLANDRLTVEELTIAGDREGRLSASGTIALKDEARFDADLTVDGDNFYIPFQKAVSARISPRLHLTGGLDNAILTGEVTITESKVNLDRLAERQYSDIQVVDTVPEGGDAPLAVDAAEPRGRDYMSPLSADILVRVPKNAWLKGQDVSAEIAGEIAIEKKPGGAFLLSGPLRTLRGNYYFMGKNFQLTKGNVEFLGLREINPNLTIEARTRIKKNEIIVALHGPANEIAIDLSSDPVMEESDIISYLVFGRPSDSIGGSQAFNVEKAALNLTGGLLAAELRNLLGDVFFIDSFAIDSGDSENGFGSVTLGKYVTPEIFISHRQGLTENDASYEEITYELTPQLKLEAQIGRDNTSSADLTWEFDF